VWRVYPLRKMGEVLSKMKNRMGEIVGNVVYLSGSKVEEDVGLPVIRKVEDLVENPVLTQELEVWFPLQREIEDE
jgi:hypothetical protein